MDAERFGRALGVGVREGAKALLKAADAAAAPNPRAGSAQAGRTPAGRGFEALQNEARQNEARQNEARQTAARQSAARRPDLRQTSQALGRGARRFGVSVWGPAARAGGVLWHEVTGVFFGLFALAAAVEVWRRRAAFATGGDARGQVWFAVTMLLVFGWFTLQSFRKARARERRR